jgi:acetate kinase
VPQVAVFDTAFHQTLPPKAYLYALPYEIYERHGVRRYGFHGSSHGYVAGEAARLIGKPLEELQLVTAHLGNGCSTCAVKAGKSVDTSMGFTPLEGLVMGTRSGDVDPNLHEFLVQNTHQTLQEVTELLNKKSGLLGLSGLSNDMRTLLAAAGENPRARVAIDVFCRRLAKSVLALCASLERLDALVFTGGIGEHAASVRAQTLSELALLGARVDEAANAEHGQATAGRITAPGSGLLALVVPTNEELVIAREAARFAQR